MHSRMAPREDPRFNVEGAYLNDLIRTLKKQIMGIGEAPETAFLMLWGEHRATLHRRHWNIPDEMFGKPDSPKEQTLAFFDALLADVAAMKDGNEPSKPITLDRMTEAHKHVMRILDVKEQRVWY